MNESVLVTSTFLYFAYGSNLLSSRLHIANPRAVFKDIARLQDYKIDFLGFSKAWSGCVGTIVKSPNSHVWGVIWEIPNEDLINLDRQEGVDVGYYKPINVNVTNSDGKIYNCRTYQQPTDPDPIVELNQLPDDRQPSLAYLKVIIHGAQDHHLPNDYVEFLKNIKHNWNETIVIEGLKICDI
ncbi:gamma-glutamylcyclotransferase-like [Microplitis mediator]|uniref:gamma-glutamylcyclotransferase-like n=1 Tax=Microplitis mediator TaxID=375433 RepID=UPI0025522F06|nr:gamma-glutamylcyclotransferase-like [Microplitis mediator]